jgi:ABC-2 type transport system ATP-binding protein
MERSMRKSILLLLVVAALSSRIGGVATYSRGMRQRLGIAEILMRKVEVAILDEPTSGLDPQTTREFLQLIRSPQGRGHDRRALLAPARSRAEHLRPRRSLQQRARRHQRPRGRPHVRRARRQVRSGGGGHRRISPQTIVCPRWGTAVKPLAGSRLRVDAMGDVRGAVARTVVEAGGELRSLLMGSASLEDVYTRYFEGVRHVA